jgi:hypothetical protein
MVFVLLEGGNVEDLSVDYDCTSTTEVTLCGGGKVVLFVWS